MSEKRIYVIIAETVQHPLVPGTIVTGSQHRTILKPISETRTIVQPKGRLGIQIGHVVSKMRMERLVYELTAYRIPRGITAKELNLAHGNQGRRLASEAITSIALAVPDSFQLEFRERLIRKTGVGVYTFYDKNPEYGRGSVKTAICTEPIERHKLRDALDYIELWRDE